MEKKNCVRFAPSPTGFLHVGGLRTALYNYLFARISGGRFILRIEDTDRERIVEGATENLIASLQAVGLSFDEGPGKDGGYGPYFQSERLEHYQESAAKLLAEGKAYRCFCTTEELDAMRKEQQKRKQQTRYTGKCRSLKPEEAEARAKNGEPSVVRMKINYTRLEVEFNDLIRGSVSFKSSQLEDQVLMKSDGFPTYHLANVVDDHLMCVSHVIRGEEWLPSTPKHVLLYEYLGWEPPQFAHLPLLLNPDKSKLSKRQGDVATEDFLKKGYLAEALVNFISLLGWNNGDEREIYSLDELAETFTLQRVGKSGAVFDIQKLDWMNKHYITQMTDDKLAERVNPFLAERYQNLSSEELIKALKLVRGGMVRLDEVNDKLDKLLQDSDAGINQDASEFVSGEERQKIFRAFVEEAQKDEEEWSEAAFTGVMKRVQKLTGAKGKELWVPIRVAISNEKDGSELPALAVFFGKEKCVANVSRFLG